MTRRECLEKAIAAVGGTDGEHNYGNGKPENNFQTIAGLWSTYVNAAYSKDVEFTAKDVSMMMILLKVARAASNNKEDTLVDLAGYAACACEMLSIADKPTKNKE